MKSSFSKVMGYVLAIFIVGALVYSLFGYDSTAPAEIPLSDVISQVESGKVDKIVVVGDELDITTTDGKEYKYRKESGVSLNESGVDTSRVEIQVKDAQSGYIWVSLLGNLIPFLLIIGFLWFMFRQAQGTGNQAMSFGRSKARVLMGGKN